MEPKLSFEMADEPSRNEIAELKTEIADLKRLFLTENRQRVALESSIFPTIGSMQIRLASLEGAIREVKSYSLPSEANMHLMRGQLGNLQHCFEKLKTEFQTGAFADAIRRVQVQIDEAKKSLIELDERVSKVTISNNLVEALYGECDAVLGKLEEIDPQFFYRNVKKATAEESLAPGTSNGAGLEREKSNFGKFVNQRKEAMKQTSGSRVHKKCCRAKSQNTSNEAGSSTASERPPNHSHAALGKRSCTCSKPFRLCKGMKMYKRYGNKAPNMLCSCCSRPQKPSIAVLPKRHMKTHKEEAGTWKLRNEPGFDVGAGSNAGHSTQTAGTGQALQYPAQPGTSRSMFPPLTFIKKEPLETQEMPEYDIKPKLTEEIYWNPARYV